MLTEKNSSSDNGLAINSLIATILLLAIIFLRFWCLEFVEFKGDEFKAIELAYKSIHTEGLTSTGLKSSTGLYNPPFFIYLISIPVYFSTDPVVVTAFVMALNAFGLILFFYLGQMLFNARLAIIMTLLFASAPGAIIYSRKIWAQDCLFPFLIAFYLVLFSNLKKYNRVKVFLMFFLLGCITQLHMSAWFLPLPLLIFFWIYKIKIPIKDLMVGIGIFCIMYAPYFISILKVNIYLFNKESVPWGFPMNLVQAFAITGGGNFDYHIGIEGMQVFAQNNHMIIFNIFFFVYYALAFVGLIYGFLNFIKSFQAIKSGNAVALKEKALTLFLLVFICIQFCYYVFRINPYPHYGLIFFPILIIFTITLLEDCFQRVGSNTKKLISFTLISIIISNIIFTGSIFKFIRDQPEKIYGDYGTPYIYAKDKWRERFAEKGIPFK